MVEAAAALLLDRVVGLAAGMLVGLVVRHLLGSARHLLGPVLAGLSLVEGLAGLVGLVVRAGQTNWWSWKSWRWT